MNVTVAGAGPAGSAAAISAAIQGASVRLQERSKFPRHKVCGEFLSPELLAPVERLGLLNGIQNHGPARIERLRLCFSRFEKTAGLPEPALGLSRYALDQLMLDRAVACGVEFEKRVAPMTERPLVVATGRSAAQPKGRRLFGFKAHFEGPPSDAIELYFFPHAYVGVNSIEQGRTNVCGIAAENLLAGSGFDYDQLLSGFAPMRERLRGMRRVMDWCSTGPLVFGNRLSLPDDEGVYRAGDALSFVDPFTGTGLASGIITGELAGRCAAQRIPVSEYLASASGSLKTPFAAASLFRAALGSRWAEAAAAILPASWLVRLTRPRRAA